MNLPSNDGFRPDANRRDSYGPDSCASGEDTLRLIASLPAPEGLADRVKAGLRTAPEAGRVLMWRGPVISARGWMYTSAARGAAAAAIVCLVAGGGWRIYSHVQPGPSANVEMKPALSAPPSSRFSTANAPRVPDTLDRPLITHPVAPAPEVDVVQKASPQPNAARGGTGARRKKTPSRPPVAPVR